MNYGKHPLKDLGGKIREYEDRAVDAKDKVNSKKGRRIIFYVVAGVAVAAILMVLSLAFGSGS